MAHSSICTLNPIMQTEILKIVDWQGEAKRAFKDNPGREHSMYVCGELANRLMYLPVARKALMHCLNGGPADQTEKELLELLNTNKEMDKHFRKTFQSSFDSKRKYRSENPDSVTSQLNGFTGYITPMWISTLLPFPLLSDDNDSRIRYTKASNKVYKFIESLGEVLV